MAWVSRGWGLTSMKIAWPARVGDRLAEAHRVAQVVGPVIGVERRGAAGAARRWW